MIEQIELSNGEFVSPSAKSAFSCVEKMDGISIDGIIISLGENSYIGISGGEDNHFFVGGFLANVGSFCLACGEDNHELVEVSVAGDYNTYQSVNVIDRNIVLDFLKDFFENMKLTGKFVWEPSPRGC